MRDVNGLWLSEEPGGEGTVGVTAHKLLAFVMPRYGPEWLVAVPSKFRGLGLQVPDYNLARLVAYQHLQPTQIAILFPSVYPILLSLYKSDKYIQGLVLFLSRSHIGRYTFND